MTKTSRARYTLEFKQEAVRLVRAGQSVAAAARTLGVVEQTLYNWVKAQRSGKLTGADSKPVSAEQMELSRLRAELARVKMERDILGKATAYFAKELMKQHGIRAKGKRRFKVTTDSNHDLPIAPDLPVFGLCRRHNSAEKYAPKRVNFKTKS